jgi:hypothetical protein
MKNLFTRPNGTVDIYYDFEFSDEGSFGTHVISVGALVEGDQGVKSFYGIDTDFFHERFIKMLAEHRSWIQEGKPANSKLDHSFMFEHVFKFIKGRIGTDAIGTLDLCLKQPLATTVAYLNIVSTQDSKASLEVVGPKPDLLRGLQHLVAEISGNAKARVRLFGYYSSFDHVCLCQLFGRMVDLPKEWNWYTYDLMTIADGFGIDLRHSGVLVNGDHNPLTDATATRRSWANLGRVLEEKKS